MNSTVRWVLASAILLILAIPAAAGAGAEIPDQAVCQVCAVNGEHRGPEKVAAASVIDGVTYYFCSKKCQDAFNADPAAYLLPRIPVAGAQSYCATHGRGRAAPDGPRRN